MPGIFFRRVSSMQSQMTQSEADVIDALRNLARQGHSVSSMFCELRKLLGGDPPIVDIISCFKKAFELSLAELRNVARNLIHFHSSFDG
ncbi:MAG: hypothetical protein K8T25_16240 [Planctomycetia bacterium]|nr:hypothetical protein [Planctomycetia bacterium]